MRSRCPNPTQIMRQGRSSRFIKTTSNASSSSMSDPAAPAHFVVDADKHQVPNTFLHATNCKFSDASSAHGSKSTYELLRAIGVFSACRLPFLVQNAEMFLDMSYKIFGVHLTNAIMKQTFFRHFCAGEDRSDMLPLIQKLQNSNIGPILDYAAENESHTDTSSVDGLQGLFTQPPFNQPARVYDYKSEEECDRHVTVFKDCIRSVHDVSPAGFAALKVTALGNPVLLERMSTMILEVKNLFAKFQQRDNSEGLISREEFVACYRHHFQVEDEQVKTLIESLDPLGTGMIDYISFAEMMTPYNLPHYTIKCKSIGPLALVTPSSDEIMLMKRISERLHTLSEEAVRCGTKLLCDAEHLKYQPAIDNLVVDLQKKFNAKNRTDRPIIFNTYQCYLKDTLEKVRLDLKRAERHSFHFGAKLVRGAYMEHERERSKELKYPSPIHDSADLTHQCYDAVVEYLMRYRWQNGCRSEIMIATHNQRSIEKAVDLMKQLGLEPHDQSVFFAQLYGMRDNLSFPLGENGYNTFKYLPYGKVQEVIPYLLRRATENSAVLGDSVTELDLLKEELYNRLTCR